MKMMVLFSMRCRRRNSSCICRRISGSSAEKGSSRNQSAGPDRQRAGNADALLLAAGELAEGRMSRVPRARPARSSLGRGTSRSFAGWPWIFSGKATLSSTLRCGSRPKFWNTMPMAWRRSSISALPLAWRRFCAIEQDFAALGSMSRDRQRTSVDLPEPDRSHDDEDLAGMNDRNWHRQRQEYARRSQLSQAAELSPSNRPSLRLKRSAGGP